MAKKYDKLIAAALVAGESADAPDFAAAAAWLTGEGELTGLAPVTALSAIQAAVTRRDIPRLLSLESSGDKALRKAARAGLHRLRSAGVEVDAPHTAARFTLATEDIPHWSTAWLSPPDTEGYSQIILFWADAGLVGFYVCEGGGGQGIREEGSELLTSTRSRMRRLHRDYQAAPEMREIPFTTGLHMVQQAQAHFQAITGRIPRDWANFLANVPEGIQTAAQLLDPIQGFPTQVDLEGLKTWETLERLVGHDWPMQPDKLGELGLELTMFLNSELEISDALRQERLAELEIKAGDAALTPDVRAALGRKLRHLAIYAIAGGQSDFAAEAWNYHLAIVGGAPAAQLPYFCHVAMAWLMQILNQMSQYGNPALEHDHDHGHGHAHD